MKRVWFPVVWSFGSCVPKVQAQDSLTSLNSSVSFLESGLTTLGVLSAAITVLARADLAYESMLRDWQYTVIDTGIDPANPGTNALLVTNLEPKTLSFLQTRLYQGAGFRSSIVKWDRASSVLGSNSKNCSCVFADCPDLGHEQLDEEWGGSRGGQVIHYGEDSSKFILYGANCWVEDAHWEYAKIPRDRVSEAERYARAQAQYAQVPQAVSTMEERDVLLIPLYSHMQHALVKMIREEFTCRDEASRNKAPRLIGALQNTSGFLDERDEDSLWQTSRWRCLFLHVIEIVVMALVTVVFTIDPFTSSLAARRVVASFVASESGGAPYAGHFVDKLRLVKATDNSLKHAYLLRVPPLAGISYLVVIAANLVIWILCVGFWLGRVGGGIPPILYDSGLFQSKPGLLLWNLGGLAQVFALIAEIATKFWLLDIHKFSLADWKLVKGMFPRVEACTTLVTLVGSIVPTVWGAGKKIELLCCVATLWMSAVVTWIVSVSRSQRHIYNSLPPTTAETCYYAVAFFKLAAITAGSGKWT